MRRSVQKEIESAGQDSFLDVVTNIVGILIILVMVVGMRAKNEPVAPVEDPAPGLSLAALRSQSAAIEQDVYRTAAEMEQLNQELLVRSREREVLATRIAAGEQELSRRRGEMDEQSRHEWGLSNALAAAKSDLESIRRQTTSAAAVTSPVVTLESYPTPMSRTVFGKEVHFRLSQGRLTYVPFEELLDRAKLEMQRRNFSRNDLPESTFEVGPLEGFRLLLTMQGKLVANTNQVMFTLKEAEFVPVTSHLGESLSEALAERSQFRSRLAGLNPRDTTMTVWFYPDSFAEFRELKKELYKMGFATAGWPLANGAHISGSPQGKRSATQ